MSFGSPRVFDLQAAKYYNTRLRDRTLRVIQGYLDPIPSLPPSMWGYVDVGMEKHVGKSDCYPHQIHGYIKAVVGDNKLSQLASTAIDKVDNAAENIVGVVQQIGDETLKQVLEAVPETLDKKPAEIIK